jgi:hypothetical protein
MSSRTRFSPRVTGILMSVLVLVPGMGLVITQQRNATRCGHLLDTQRRVTRWINQRKPFVVDVAMTKGDGSTVKTTAEVFGKTQVSRVVTTAADTSTDVTWWLDDGSTGQVFKVTNGSEDWPDRWHYVGSLQPSTVPYFGLDELVRACERRNGILLDGGVRFENPILEGVEFMRITAAFDPVRSAESRKRLGSFRACRNAGADCRVEAVRV